MSDTQTDPKGVGEPFAAAGSPADATAERSGAAPAAEAAVRQKPKIGDTRPAPVIARTAAPIENGAGAAAPVKPRRRRRGGRGRGGRTRQGQQAAATDPVAPAPTRRPRAPRASAADGDTADSAPVSTRRRGRERKGRPVGRYLMCVHVGQDATQIAVLEGRSLIELHVARSSDDANQIDGNIYRGRVKNVLPGMEAAFVDIGTPKNAVLYWGDVQTDRGDDIEREPGTNRIEHLLRPGQTIICQVTKNPIGLKGARLTQEVSLPGRFVVLVPDSPASGISKRLDDKERRRLRKILDEIRPEGHGIILRTAAEGATADELRRDVAQLLKKWDDIADTAKHVSAPALLYSEPHLALRAIREEFTEEYRGVIIDDRELYTLRPRIRRRHRPRPRGPRRVLRPTRREPAAVRTAPRPRAAAQGARP